MYFLYLTGYYLAKVLPIKVCYVIAGVVARIYFIFAKKDKANLRSNLKVILAGEASEALIGRHIFEIFKNFAKYLADFVKFTKFSPEYIEKNINIEGRHFIDECLREGKGIICVALHLGNWELGGAILPALGYPMSAIVLEHKDKRTNDFFVRQRAINNLKSIHISIALKKCFAALKNNELLAIVGDKDYTSTGEYVDFFGRKALLPKGPAVLSLKTGAPLVFSCLIREKGDKFKFVFEEPIKPVSTGDLKKDMHNLMSRYIKTFERYIRQYPDQWYAFNRVWEDETLQDVKSPITSKQE